MRDRTPWSIGSRTNFYLVDPSPMEKVAMVAAGLPLRFEAVSIGGEEDNQVALVPLDESSVANAEFIVKAANAYDDLVAAADHLIKELNDWSLDCCREGLGHTNVACIKNARDVLRAAIERAEGRGE